MRSWKSLAVLILVLFVGFGSYVSVEAVSAKSKKAASPVQSDTFSNLFETSKKHTVRITINGKSQGSGIVWTSDGYVLTNAHVAGEAKEIKVYVSEKKFYKASVVGTDTEMDVALLKINDAVSLTMAPIGNSNLLRPGDWVYAIGTPFGLYQSITVGVVSGMHRRGEGGGVQEVIQTDAAINPGNSGGPLHNIKGEVIGMNVFIIKDANTVGFSIPINDVILVAKALKAKGKMIYARFGVEIADWAGFDEESAKAQNIPWPPLRDKGVLVMRVEKDTGAFTAGVQVGDVIVSFNSVLITETFQFQRLVARSPVGVPLPVVVLRNGKEVRLEVVLTERPPAKQLDDALPEMPEKQSFPNFGESMKILPPAVRGAVFNSQGILVEISFGWNNEVLSRVTNAFLVDSEHLVTVASFLNKDMEKALQARYVFNKIPAKLVFADMRVGLAMFKLEKPYPNYKTPVSFSDRNKVGEQYFSLVIKNIKNGDSLPYADTLLNKVDSFLIFPARVKKAGLGAPIFTENGEIVGMWFAPNADPDDLSDTPDSMMVFPANIIQLFVQTVRKGLEKAPSEEIK